MSVVLWKPGTWLTSEALVTQGRLPETTHRSEEMVVEKYLGFTLFHSSSTSISLWVNPVPNQLMQESRKHSLKITTPSLLKLHPHYAERGRVLNGSEGRQAQDQHVLHLNNVLQPRNILMYFSIEISIKAL